MYLADSTDIFATPKTDVVDATLEHFDGKDDRALNAT